MIAASTFYLIFRIFHIMFGVAWVGSAFLLTVFFEPAINKLGPAAGPVMEELVGRRKVGEIVTGIAVVTVIAGWVLWTGNLLASPSLGDWLGSTYGLVLTIGGIAATGAFVAGFVGIPPNLNRLNALGKEIGASDGPPSPEQQAEMRSIQQRMARLSRVDLGLLLVAVFCMATARYW